MKKLMLTAAIVCATVMAQAATTKWAATTGDNIIYASGTTDTPLSSGTAYLFCSYTADTATKATIYSQDDILNEFKKGTDLSTLNYQKDLTVGENGKIASTPFTSEDFATSKQTKFFFALVKDDEIYISSVATKTSNGTTQQTMSFNPTTTSQAPAMDIDDGYKSAGWYGAVPEPTSGLLLLLGVAGLALKRKRA